MEPVRTSTTQIASLYKMNNLVPSSVRISLSKRSLDLDETSRLPQPSFPTLVDSDSAKSPQPQLHNRTIFGTSMLPIVEWFDDESSCMDVEEELEVDCGPTTGTHANIVWRAVPMEDLRSHPQYKSLPSPSSVVVTSLKDLCLFAQDSWQWDALHQGRLTTSKLASVLGFYEAEIGEFLHIPRSLRGHARAVAAWQHVRQKPPPDWTHLVSSPPSSAQPPSSSAKPPLWIKNESSDRKKFSYRYNPLPSATKSNLVKRDAQTLRLCWGSTQEATAILAVLNFLSQHDPGAVIAESGMCVFEALDEYQAGRGVYSPIKRWIEEERCMPPLGASPDGLIYHANNTISVLEVKCFSPFVRHEGSTLQVSTQRPDKNGLGVPVWHVPQLQLEMLCAGSRCINALLIVLYVDGAMIYRVDRDEKYQLEMMAWTKDFYNRFIKSAKSNSMKAPPPNFFSPRSHKGAYGKFLERTKQIAREAVLIAELSKEDVQRSPLYTKYFLEYENQSG